MIAYINGSPKLNKSASNYFLNSIKECNDKIYYVYKDSYEYICSALRQCETLVVAFPLYADSPCSGILELFEYIQSNNINLKNKNMYIIVNCGFLESYQNDIAIDIINCFCKNNHINFKGYFSIGAGPIFGIRDSRLLYKIITLPYLYKKNILKDKISKKEKVELSTTVLIPRFLYVLFANASWKKSIKLK